MLPLVTPDGRYMIVQGRLWRRSNPSLDDALRQRLVAALMANRRAVRDALRNADNEALRTARAGVQATKVALGERGPVWWTDDAPDENRRMVTNSSYALWYASLDAET